MTISTPTSNDPVDESPAAVGTSAETTWERPAVPFETTPALKPTLLLIGLTVLVGSVSVGYLVANPQTIAGNAGLTELVWNAIGILVTLVLLRLVIRLYILSRTTYIVESDVLRREFTLLYRHHAREIPITQLRGHEFNQNRTQRLLGFGTIRLLTGGTNQSLGFLKFDDIPNPGIIRNLIRSLIEELDGADPRPTSRRSEPQETTD